jgi:hypothetical protein
MTCVELQESLAVNEAGTSPEQRAHLKDCPDCSVLVADLLVIACAAGELRSAEEPSPRVWKNIETALRREGLIRPQTAGHSLLPTFHSPWAWARWMAPAAAALLVFIGIYVRQNVTRPAGTDRAAISPLSTPASDLQVAGLNDDDLLQEVSQQSPAMQEQYTDNLRRVNAYIEDAKSAVDANPNDEEARRSLMDAYQEKAMLFELALDRSLP